MSSTEDILLKLKDFIREENRKQTETLSKEFETVKELVAAQKGRIDELEKQLEELKIRNKNLERAQRKNNLIIFNLEYTAGDLLQYTVTRLNEILKINISGNDVSDIYTIGSRETNKPIIIHFVSYLKKKIVLSNCFNLKNTGISITDQLSPEERSERKILVEHLKIARSQQRKAHIKGNNLYIEGQRYLAEELVTKQSIIEPEEKRINRENLVQKLSSIPEESTGSEATVSNVVKRKKLDVIGNRASSRLEGKARHN